MDLFPLSVWVNGKLFGVDWHFWKIVGWVGNIIFFSRFFVQWLATERSKQVVVPAAFWWLSLIGSLCLLSYGLSKQDSVFIFAYLFTWIPYIRNLVIAHRQRSAALRCPSCGVTAPAQAIYCCACGARLAPADMAASSPHPVAN